MLEERYYIKHDNTLAIQSWSTNPGQQSYHKLTFAYNVISQCIQNKFRCREWFFVFLWYKYTHYDNKSRCENVSMSIKQPAIDNGER